MSIEKRQSDRMTNQIIKEIIQGGTSPEYETITYKLYKWQKKHTPGTPSLKPRLVEPHSTSISENYNLCLQEIIQDLSDIFEETKEQSNRLLINFDYSETERQRLLHEISKISSRIDNFLLISKDTDGYVEAFADTFDSFEHIDTVATTANVNLGEKQVTLGLLDNDLEKIDLSSSPSSVSCSDQSAVVRNIESIKNCFDDNINSSWRCDAITKESKKLTLNLDILISITPIPINEISFSSHSPKPTLITIYWSNDGNNWKALSNQQTKNVVSSATWNFGEIEASYIRFALSKDIHDEYINSEYVYHFGCKNISILRVGFVEESTLVSKEFHTKRDQISRVSIDVEHEIPTGTSIEYFISPVGDDGELEYQSISPISSEEELHPKEIDLSVLQMHAPEIITPITNDNYTLRGITFYNIYATSHKPIKGTENLYIGIRQWKRDHFFYIPEQKISLDPNEYVPNINDFMKLPVSRTDYTSGASSIQLTNKHVTTAYIDAINPSGIVLPLNTELIPNGFNDVSYDYKKRGHYMLYTLCVYSSTWQAPTVATLSSTGCKVAAYLNRHELYGQNVRVENGVDKCDITYELIAGWNIFQYVVYKNVNDDTSILSINPGITSLLQQIIDKDEHLIRANVHPLTLVDKYTLENNVLINDFSRYSIDTSGSSTKIVVNYDPSDYSGYTNNSKFVIKYAAKYNYINDDNIIKKIKLMAILRRDPSSDMITPKIYKYMIKAL